MELAARPHAEALVTRRNPACADREVAAYQQLAQGTDIDTVLRQPVGSEQNPDLALVDSLKFDA